MSLRHIARHLGVYHRTVSLWVNDRTAQLPNPPITNEVKEVEMDEPFTFIGENTADLHPHIGRSSDALFTGLPSFWQRTQAAIQEMVVQAPKTKRDDNDAFDV